jgi:hypothetical protein
MKATDAFDICHEIYSAAREMVDSRLPTMQLDSASKFLWRPNMRPRLVEYVADFALAGQRALTPAAQTQSTNGRAAANNSQACACSCEISRDDCAGAATESPRSRLASACSCGVAQPLSASRLILFRMYYLGGAEYHAARNALGIGELTWSAWTDEIRSRVGRELLRREMFPPSRYFRQPSRKHSAERRG